ncbi:carboxylesterase family protein [Amycolatopsis sp. NPDC051372]
MVEDSGTTAVVSTTDGPVRGTCADGVRRFLGVPYAMPPTGDRRWRPPVAPVPWTEVRDATSFGAVCAQDSTGLPGFGHFSETEDCLYLNVFTPDRQDREQVLPVMVWFPGGGLYCGGSTGYEPHSLVVDGSVVVVSVNYRLNVFGFFSHPAINSEGHPAGNYGIMDQQLALRWVRRNIAQFGGDPGNVTIFGESAGAISVLAHIASPGSAELFHRAILQSCGPTALMATPSIESLAHVGEGLAAAAGCAAQTPDGLRALTTRELLDADAMAEQILGVGKYHIGLVADGSVIPERMSELFSTGRFNRVPVINGVNRNEFTWFQAMMELHTGHVISADEYPHAVAAALAALAQVPVLGTTVPDDALPEILDRYPCAAYPSPASAVAAIVGDCGLISAGGRRTTRVIAEFVPEVYFYEWDVPDSPVSWPEVSFPYGSGHTQELQYLFRGFHGGGGTPRELTKPQQRLARHMVAFWTGFARCGEPDAGIAGGPIWAPYEHGADNAMILTTPESGMVNSFGQRHHSDFWDALTRRAAATTA